MVTFFQKMVTYHYKRFFKRSFKNVKQNNLISTYIVSNKLNIEQVILDFTPYLHTIIKNTNYGFCAEDMEEIVSDVFLIVWKNQKKLDTEKPMSSYLVGITKNMLHKKLRNLRRNSNIVDFENYLGGIEDVEFELENEERNNLILSELNKMKLEDKEIFLLYYYHSKTMKEIAMELNISDEKVKSRLFRIRKKLKKALEKRGYHCGGCV